VYGSGYVSGLDLGVGLSLDQSYDTLFPWEKGVRTKETVL